MAGDPRQDMEYERQYQSSYIVPEVIKNFLVFFQKSINEQVLAEVQNCYENGWAFTALQWKYTVNILD